MATKSIKESSRIDKKNRLTDLARDPAQKTEADGGSRRCDFQTF
jgi:hypothetical protein